MAGITSQTETGAPKQTGQELDFMIEGDGYFCVQGEEGLSYTRAGNFTVSKDGRLATADGEYVLDTDHGYIEVKDDEGKSGLVGLDGKIGVFTFTNPLGLTSTGDGLMEESLASGTAVQAQNISVRQGYLEGSGVDIASEMSKMISAQRSFQANARMISAADEIEETANGLRS